MLELTFLVKLCQGLVCQMAAVGNKQDLVWFPISTRATALNLSCTAYWKAKFTPRLEARLVNWAECLTENGSSRKAH